MHILNHRIYGSGQPVIYILHGIFGMMDNWHYVAGKLAENYTVVTSDARNHGKSFHTDNMSFETMADDVKTLMQHLGHEQIILMGHSMGGKTAMAFATKYSQHLQKLIIVDIANKSYPPAHTPYFQAFAEIDFTKIASRAEAEKALMPYAPDLTVRQFLLKNLEPIQGGGYRAKFNISAIKAHYDEIIGKTELQSPTFNGPTLFISGEKSGYLKESDKPELLAAFPLAKFIQVSRAGHWVHADNPTEFLETLQTFIQS